MQAQDYVDLGSLRAAVAEWLVALRRPGRRRFRLLGRELSLGRFEGELYLSGELALGGGVDDALLLRICSLALPSVRHFRAVVAVGEDARHLKFFRGIAEARGDAVLQGIEQMVNQMDVWQRLLADATTPGKEQE